MIISLRRWWNGFKYIVLFIMLAYVMYKTLGLLDEYVLTMDKYRIPDGSAIKVFQSDAGGAVSGLEGMSDRFKLFLWYGE